MKYPVKLTNKPRIFQTLAEALRYVAAYREWWRHEHRTVRCTYCNSPYGDTLDHVVPWSYTHGTKRRGKPGAADNGHRRVPACRECNNLLSDALLFTVRERRAYVRQRLRERYGVPVRWTDEELDELGPTLRSAILAGNA